MSKTNTISEFWTLPVSTRGSARFIANLQTNLARQTKNYVRKNAEKQKLKRISEIDTCAYSTGQLFSQTIHAWQFTWQKFLKGIPFLCIIFFTWSLFFMFFSLLC